MTNPYVRYYLDQQQGHGMPVFRGSPWQMGYGQMGYGLGGLFRSLAKIAIPLVKSGVKAAMPSVRSGGKALGKIALSSGKDLMGDLFSGKNLKQAAKARALEAANVAKRKAMQRVQTFAQTGSGSKRTDKKRKAPASGVRSKQPKKRKTSPADIFG